MSDVDRKGNLRINRKEFLRLAITTASGLLLTSCGATPEDVLYTDYLKGHIPHSDDISSLSVGHHEPIDFGDEELVAPGAANDQVQRSLREVDGALRKYPRDFFQDGNFTEIHDNGTTSIERQVLLISNNLTAYPKGSRIAGYKVASAFT